VCRVRERQKKSNRETERWEAENRRDLPVSPPPCSSQNTNE
jgi:hypothetical protein